MATLTRAKDSNCPLFGVGVPFNENVLPTYGDILRQYIFTRNYLKLEGQLKEPTFSEVVKIIVPSLETLWKKASIPIISTERIIERIRDYHCKYRNLMKPFKQRSNIPSFIKKTEEFKDKSKVLFDIASCKCKNCEKCICEKNKKVPVTERLFLLDQRTARKMMIGNIDNKTTKQLQEREKRKLKQEQFLQEANSSKMQKFDKPDKATSVELRDSLLDDLTMNSDLPLFEDITTPSTSSGISTYGQMRKTLPTLARECDRWGLSDRGAAAVSSALLQDLGIVHENDTASIIDRSKIRRERQKCRSKFQCDSGENEVLRSIYFDGRKDPSRKTIIKDGVYHPVTTIEEHIVILREPNSEYLGHVTPPSGNAINISNAITDYCLLKKYDTQELIAIGCDGTNVNTGYENGVIRKLELHYNKSLHWFVCLLHTNELPLRHLFTSLDGATHGPKSFGGPIGKSLKECAQPVIKFKPIEGHEGYPLPEIDLKELSNDQKYLYKMVLAVISGECNKDLANIQPGPISHSRWLTTAIRILRLYVSSNEPSQNLIILATYVVKVYAPVWFSIKVKSACWEGPRHLWKLIFLTRYLPKHLKDVVDPVIQRNAYFAHPENLLLAMIKDKRPNIRKLALCRIIRTREQQRPNSIRQFKVPVLNFDAQEYYEMIDHESFKNIEPPLTRSLTTAEIKNYITNGEEMITFPKLVCHTQAVERCVRLVTEAAAAVGDLERDGYIRSRLMSRSIMPRYNKKSEYKLM